MQHAACTALAPTHASTSAFLQSSERRRSRTCKRSFPPRAACTRHGSRTARCVQGRRTPLPYSRLPATRGLCTWGRAWGGGLSFGICSAVRRSSDPASAKLVDPRAFFLVVSNATAMAAAERGLRRGVRCCVAAATPPLQIAVMWLRFVLLARR